MKEVLDKNPEVVANAAEAITRAGLKVKTESIRGGTDGSRLSFMGLPCPNIFTGMQGIHSKLEWIGVKDMTKSAETIVPVSYTHLRAHETDSYLVCRLLLEKKKKILLHLNIQKI